MLNNPPISLHRYTDTVDVPLSDFIYACGEDYFRLFLLFTVHRRIVLSLYYTIHLLYNPSCRTEGTHWTCSSDRCNTGFTTFTFTFTICYNFTFT